MKYNNFIIIISVFILSLFTSCQEDLLDKTPLDRYSSSTVWADIDLANTYLTYAYREIWHGFQTNASINSLSDECMFIHSYDTEVYLMNRMTPDNLGIYSHNRFRHKNWSLWMNVQRINEFLDNVDKIPAAYPETQKAAIQSRVEVLKGEALFLRAWCYSQLVRGFGGLPIMKTAWKIGDDYLSVERASFEETINFIVEDIDKAVPLLKSKKSTEAGRATKGAALSLKSRILLFAASDLTADGKAKSKYVGYENPNRQVLWTAAKNAAKAVMDLNEYELANFGAPNKDAVAQNYFDFFKQKTLENKEIIWGKMFVSDIGDRHYFNRWQGPNGIQAYGSTNPTQSIIDKYQMEDGSNFFDHFYVDEEGYYKNKGTTKYRSPNPYHNREPRFYGSVLADSSIWQKRFADLKERDPLGIYDRRTRVVIQGGKEISKVYGIDSRNGPVQAWNAGYSGYLIKKMMDDTHDRNTYNTNIWIWFRYAEILLNYAEACIELGETVPAASIINQIRNRSGLPDFEGDIRVAYRRERQIELAYEDHRFDDMRRWKIMLDVLTDAKGMDIIETKNLDDGTTSTTWQLILIQKRTPSEKMYWIPIPRDEMNRAPQLVQNPGYE